MSVTESVQEYYGKILQKSEDLKTNACCCADGFPKYQREILNMIEPEILEKFYGCGSPIPFGIEGRTILDLGSGTGRDAYLASKLVGENGTVIGVDMTQEQLVVANKYREIQAKKFNYRESNVEFYQGYIEDLRTIGIADNSIDVIISNCVINLSPDKRSVFAEAFRVLKPGGELYFSDVFASSRISDDIRNDPVFYGECLGGAMYIEDFRRILKDLGCADYRIMSCRPITINNEEMEIKAANVKFNSITVRAFKLDDLEDICEDYGQVATYKGTLEHSPNSFVLDDHHEFIAHKPMLVCGNTASMLSNTRFAKYFDIIGDRSRHFGPFECSPASSKQANASIGGACC